MTLILNQQNAKVFLREIIDIFQNVKAFFHHKKNHKTGQSQRSQIISSLTIINYNNTPIRYSNSLKRFFLDFGCPRIFFPQTQTLF